MSVWEMLISKAHNFLYFVCHHFPLLFPLYIRQYTCIVYQHLQAQSKGHYGFCSRRVYLFPTGWTVKIRNTKHVQKPILYLADSALCNLVRHSKENTLCVDLIESAANRNPPLCALSDISLNANCCRTAQLLHIKHWFNAAGTAYIEWLGIEAHLKWRV